MAKRPRHGVRANAPGTSPNRPVAGRYVGPNATLVYELELLEVK